jgi:AraC-like DNA-binding protein
MKRFAPSEALAPFVRRFEIVETTEEMTRTLLPEPGLVVAFRFAGSAALLEQRRRRPVPDSAITGPRTTARRISTSAGGGLVVAKLRAACAGRFLGVPPNELFGEVLALDQVVRPAEVARTSSAIQRANDDAERIAALERFLHAITRPWRPDSAVLKTIRAIDAASGTVRVSALARDAAVSQDTLEKRFRRVVGTTPKQFASIVRLRRAVEACKPGRSFTEVSADAGYCDQSHFIRQFRQVTGLTPQGFFGSSEYCSASLDTMPQRKYSSWSSSV